VNHENTSEKSSKNPTPESVRILRSNVVTSAGPPLVNNSPFSSNKTPSAKAPKVRVKKSGRLPSPPKHLLDRQIKNSDVLSSFNFTPKRASVRIQKQLEVEDILGRTTSNSNKTPSRSVRKHSAMLDEDEISSARKSKRVVSKQSEASRPIKIADIGHMSDEPDETSESRRLRSSSRQRIDHRLVAKPVPVPPTPIRRVAKTPKKSNGLPPPSRSLRRQLGIEVTSEGITPTNSDDEDSGRMITRMMAKK
jgi:hypothetical protein